MKKLLYFIAFLTIFNIPIYTQEKWQQLSSGTNYLLNGVFFTDAETGYAVGYNTSFDSGMVLKTTDGGNAWFKLIESANPMFSVLFTDANTGYITAFDTILKTTDAGANWSKYPINMGVGILAIHFYNSTTGFAAGMNMSGICAVLKTTDSGTTWTVQTISSPEHYRINSLFCTNENTCYLAGGYALKTTDGGTTWDNITTASNSDWSGVYFTDSNNGVIVGGMQSYGAIDHTTDGGNSWSTVNIGSKFIYTVDFIDTETGFAVGDDGIIFKTTDGGINWISKTSPVVDKLYSVHFPSSNIGYAAGDNGTIIKYVLTGDTSNVSIQVKTGWNLLSLPVTMANSERISLFPSSTSQAFIFDDYYQSKDTLEPGYGFWLKFDSDSIIMLEGEFINHVTMNVKVGWNMVGSRTKTFPVNKITTEPDNIIISDFFNYSAAAGYQTADSIKPGIGYWIKVNQSGLIILFPTGTTCPVSIDYAGKAYNAIQIGSQCWLKENLDVGTMIDSLQDQTDNDIIEKYCYNNEPINCNTYGGLYQWNEAMQYTTIPGTRGICPQGWHIPTLTEFQTLSNTVSGDGNALKAIGQGTGDGSGTNTSGFSALLSGARYRDGYFYLLGLYSGYWISTEYESNAYFLDLIHDGSVIDLGEQFKNNGFSIRCLQD